MLKRAKVVKAFNYPTIAQLVERPTVVLIWRSHRTVPGSNPGCRMFFLISAHLMILLCTNLNNRILTTYYIYFFID